VLVPISNPRTESRIVDLACTLANDHENAVVHAVHIVQIPNRRSMRYGSGRNERIISESEKKMEGLRDTISSYDIDYETSTVVSHRSFEDVFDTAERERADLVVLGWGDNQPWGAGPAESRIRKLTNNLPCDFLVLKDRDLDTSRILLPTAGGPDSDLSAEVARTLSCKRTDRTSPLARRRRRRGARGRSDVPRELGVRARPRGRRPHDRRPAISRGRSVAKPPITRS